MGTLRNSPFSGTEFVANYGWQISVADIVPGPSSIAFLAADTAVPGVLVRRRRAANL